MYKQLGFVRDGDEFLDDGIPHVPMLRSHTEIEQS
jgi:ElaA protein